MIRRAAFRITMGTAMPFGHAQLFLAHEFRSANRVHQLPYALTVLFLWLPAHLTFRILLSLAERFAP